MSSPFKRFKYRKYYKKFGIENIFNKNTIIYPFEARPAPCMDCLEETDKKWDNRIDFTKKVLFLLIICILITIIGGISLFFIYYWLRGNIP